MRLYRENIALKAKLGALERHLVRVETKTKARIAGGPVPLKMTRDCATDGICSCSRSLIARLAESVR